MAKTDPALLARLGYTPGTFKRWCSACGAEHEGMDAKAFKCKPCATKQAKRIEGECRQRFEDADAR
jgi:hypothetical protein